MTRTFGTCQLRQAPHVFVAPPPCSAIHFRCAAAGSVSIPAALVKELRSRTGASMGKCKQALSEEAGDVEKAVEWLKKRGIRSMEKRAADAAEALLALSVGPEAGAIVELRAETDFVTKGALFQRLALSLAQTAVGCSADNVQAQLPQVPLIPPAGEPLSQVSDGASVETALLEMGSVVGERFILGDVLHLGAPQGGTLAGYAHPRHSDALPGTGRMAAMVALSAVPPDTNAKGLSNTAALLARHIVAAQPRYTNVDRVPPEVLEKEKETSRQAHLEQLGEKKAANVSEEVMKKVLDGKVKKFYQDAVLLHQELIIPQAATSDNTAPKSMSVEAWLKSQASEIGVEKIEVEDFKLLCL